MLLAMQAVDVARVWDLLHSTAAAASVSSSGPEIAAQVNGSSAPGMDLQDPLDGQSLSSPGDGHLNGDLSPQRPQVPTRVALGGRNGLQMLMLPPPQARDDPLAVVDLCRAAEVSCAFTCLLSLAPDLFICPMSIHILLSS